MSLFLALTIEVDCFSRVLCKLSRIFWRSCQRNCSIAITIRSLTWDGLNSCRLVFSIPMITPFACTPRCLNHCASSNPSMSGLALLGKVLGLRCAMGSSCNFTLSCLPGLNCDKVASQSGLSLMLAVMSAVSGDWAVDGDASALLSLSTRTCRICLMKPLPIRAVSFDNGLIWLAVSLI